MPMWTANARRLLIITFFLQFFDDKEGHVYNPANPSSACLKQKTSYSTEGRKACEKPAKEETGIPHRNSKLQRNTRPASSNALLNRAVSGTTNILNEPRKNCWNSYYAVKYHEQQKLVTSTTNFLKKVASRNIFPGTFGPFTIRHSSVVKPYAALPNKMSQASKASSIDKNQNRSFLPEKHAREQTIRTTTYYPGTGRASLLQSPMPPKLRDYRLCPAGECQSDNTRHTHREGFRIRNALPTSTAN